MMTFANNVVLNEDQVYTVICFYSGCINPHRIESIAQSLLDLLKTLDEGKKEKALSNLWNTMQQNMIYDQYLMEVHDCKLDTPQLKEQKTKSRMWLKEYINHILRLEFD